MVYYVRENESRFKKFINGEKLPYILLGIIILLIIGLVYLNYLWIKTFDEIDLQNARSDLAEQEIKKIRLEARKISVETLVYRSDGYEISYPRDWNFRETLDYAVFEPQAEVFTDGQNAEVPGLLFISIKENPMKLGIQQWLEQNDELTGIGGFDHFISFKEADELKKMFEADKAFRLDYAEKVISLSGVDGLEQYIDNDGGSARVIYLPFNDRLYILTVSSGRHFNPEKQDTAVLNFLSVADEVIKTFKLIQ